MPKRYILPSCSNERKKQQKGACGSSDVEKSVFGNFHQVLVYFQNGVEEGSVFQMLSSVFCTSISI